MQSSIAIRSRLALRYRGKALHATARNKRHSLGTPLSTCVPRGSKAMPEPATRSRTVCETRTSPGPASPPTRANVHRDSREIITDDLALKIYRIGLLSGASPSFGALDARTKSLMAVLVQRGFVATEPVTC